MKFEVGVPKVMWSNLKIISTNFLRQPEWFIQAKRTTYILRRMHPPKLNKMSSMFPKKLKKRSFYYELVEDTNVKKKPPLQLVLTDDVPGIGVKGELVETNMYVGYRDLILPKLALYATSKEAQSILLSKDEKQKSKYSKIVENYLASEAVEIILTYDQEWTLEPWHVKLALRKNGILTNEDCITIPKKISGPNLEIENKDFIVYLTMNKLDKFPLRCRIYHWSNLEPGFNQKSIDVFSPSEPLFPDEKETIETLIRIDKEIKRNKMLKQISFDSKQSKKN